MNTTLLNHSNPSDPIVETCQAVVFKVADRYLALPQTAIVRVISANLLIAQASAHQQLLLLEGVPLTVLPLDRLFAPTQSLPHPFFIIARHPDNLLAIPVSEPPILLDLPLTKISVIPPLHRQQIDNIANYIAFVDYQNQQISLLLLDLKQAVQSTISLAKHRESL